VSAPSTMVAQRREPAHGPVVEVTLDRPQALNAICTDMARELTATMVRLAQDETVRAVVLTSSSARAFSVGADLKERAPMDQDELLAHREVSRAAYASVLDLPVPAVAAVAGYALGGGFELALSCDLIVASAGAVFALPEVGVGLVPGGGGTQLLTRRVGWSRAAGMVFTARRVGLEEASHLGVVDEVAPAGEARRAALQRAWSISENSPAAVRYAKAAMRGGADLDLKQGLEREDHYWRQAVAHGDRTEGITAFNEKRPPSWHPGDAPSV